ncbi:MAG: YbaK/EbsC family protein [Desulfovibrionaceae bacterium]
MHDQSQPLRKSAQKVADILEERGFSCVVTELAESSRTAQQAADVVGCSVAQIVKSLVLRGKESGEPYLCEVSGVNRLDTNAVAALVGEPVKMAEADFVRAVTGYAIGGIPPVGHARDIRTFIDQDLWIYGELWAAAGTPYALFRLTPDELLAMTGGQVAELAKSGA